MKYLIGIDLGTCNTLVYVRGQGIVLSEPSVVAVYQSTNKVLSHGTAVGERAKRMVGRTPGSIVAVRPLRNGVIADFQVTEAMLNYFISKVHNFSSWRRPRVVISIPSGSNEVEKRAVMTSAIRAGARRVYLLPETMAAAIGLELPIDEPIGSMVVDIGGGTTEIACISMMDVVHCESVRMAGDHLDDAIASYMKRQYQLIIGESTAERIKMEIGSAVPLEQELETEVMGRSQTNGLPRSLKVKSQEIREEALKEPIHTIIAGILNALERIPPELASDIYTTGISLTGGGALLRGLDKLITKDTRGIPVHVSNDPLRSVVRGTGIVIEDIDTVGPYLESSDDRT